MDPTSSSDPGRRTPRSRRTLARDAFRSLALFCAITFVLLGLIAVVASPFEGDGETACAGAFSAVVGGVVWHVLVSIRRLEAANRSLETRLRILERGPPPAGPDPGPGSEA